MGFPHNAGLCEFQMYSRRNLSLFHAEQIEKKSKIILRCGTLVGSSKCVTLFKKYSDKPVAGMNIFSFQLAVPGIYCHILSDTSIVWM